MTTHTRATACSKAILSRTHFSVSGLVKLSIALAVPLFLMYAETWAIQEVPLWSSACASRPAAVESDGPLRDTAGPIAVLH